MEITQPIESSHRFNTILIRFSHTVIDYVVYTWLIQSENRKHAVDVVHTVFLSFLFI
jgi:hypothetical protein